MKRIVLSAIFAGAAACSGAGGGSSDGGTGSGTGSGADVGAGCKATVPASSAKCELGKTDPLVNPRTAATAFLAGDDVVLAGGQGAGGLLSTDLMAAKVSSGKPSGWRGVGSLPKPLPNAAFAFRKDRLYAFGGEVPGTIEGSKEAWSAPRGSDGAFGAFEAAKPLEAPRTWATAVTVGDDVFLLGGKAALNAAEEAAVIAVRFDDAGAVTAYENVGNLTSTRSKASAVARGGRIYVVGGNFPGNDKQCAANTVLYSTVANGRPGPFLPATSLPKLPAGSALVAGDTHLFVVGGVGGFGDTGGSVLAAKFEADGSLGGWQRVGFLPDLRYGHAAVATGGRLFALGGLVNQIEVLDEVLEASIGADAKLSCP